MKSSPGAPLQRAVWPIGVSLFLTSLLSAQTDRADLALGRKVFDKVCAECHAKTGRGDGPKARRMGFVSRDFSLGSFKCRCTPSGTLPTDEDLLRTIDQGLPGSAMPSHATVLDSDEKSAVLAYLKTFSSRFSEDTPPACVSIPPPPEPSVDLVAEGQRIYGLLSCWSCHGVDGRGKGPAAALLTDDWGGPIKVHNFVVMRNFKCGNSVSDLYRTLHTGLNGTPMPSYSDAFLFVSGSIKDFSSFEDLGDEEVEQLRKYLEAQPDRGALSALSTGEKNELVEHRTWALAYYLKSMLQVPRKK